MSHRMPLPPHHFTIMLPHDQRGLKVGCFGQSSGLLQCAFQDEGGRTITVFSLDSYRPCKWSLKHRLCMRDALGRDDFIRSGDSWPSFCDYRIVALDLEKGVLLLVDDNLMKLLSYNINTGKLSGIKNGSHPV
uniref:F-box associated domain-containing protein n=1 Tax=Aegilops tauschii TaxID=37682 RepID=M8C5F8_AEGTA